MVLPLAHQRFHLLSTMKHAHRLAQITTRTWHIVRLGVTKDALYHILSLLLAFNQMQELGGCCPNDAPRITGPSNARRLSRPDHISEVGRWERTV